MSSCSMLVLLKPQRSMSSSRDPLSHMLGTPNSTSSCTRIGWIFLIMLGKLHSEGWEWHASSMSLASNVWTLIWFLRFDPDLFQQWWILTYFWQQKNINLLSTVSFLLVKAPSFGNFSLQGVSHSLPLSTWQQTAGFFFDTFCRWGDPNIQTQETMQGVTCPEFRNAGMPMDFTI